MARIGASEKRWVEGFRFGAIVVKSIALVWAVGLMMSGLQMIVLSQPENIDALGRFVEKIRMGEALGYAIAGVMGLAYYRERKGKKRAIEIKGCMQRELESNDPERSTSGLSPQGDCPKEGN